MDGINGRVEKISRLENTALEIIKNETQRRE